MPGPYGPFGDALVAAVREGRVSEAAVDDKVARLLRLAQRVGALGERHRSRRAPGPTTRSPPSCAPPPPRASCSPATTARCCRSARARCARSPCSAPTPPTRARSAAGRRPSSRTTRSRRSTGCARRSRTPRSRTRPACATHTRLPVAPVSAADVRFFAADGTVLGAEHREIGEFTWLGTLDPNDGRDRGPHDPARDRRRRARRRLLGRRSLPARRCGGEPAFDVELTLREGADIAEALFAPPQHGVPVTLAAGETLEIVLRRERRRPAHTSASSSTSSRRSTRRPSSSAPSRSRARRTSRSSSSARRRRSRARASTARRWRCPAARTSSCGASTRRSRAPSSWSTPARRCCCRGWTRCRACCCAGSRARRRATRSPTCSSAPPSPAAACR